jgi:DmsE family decaheme c-type cytochrome
MMCFLEENVTVCQRVLLCGFLLLSIPLCSVRGAAQAAPAMPADTPVSSHTTPATAESKAAGYVGSETCKTCHQELYASWEKTPHWRTVLNTKGGASMQGCEACHGPGKAHVDGGGDVTRIFTFKNASVKTISDRCLSCHAGGAEHMSAISSVHSQNGVSCLSCHSPHHAETREFLLTKAQPQLCYSCHAEKRAEFAMPFHHRVQEGLLQCTDCHNPHGTVQPKQVRMAATQDAVCFKCHTDKQGPFIFEHEPVKIEGCQACHTPHGGANPHMLRVSNVNLLCLQCHTNVPAGTGAPGTPSFHSQQTFFKSCTLCHIQIHGSNFDSTFFK